MSMGRARLQKILDKLELVDNYVLILGKNANGVDFHTDRARKLLAEVTNLLEEEEREVG